MAGLRIRGFAELRTRLGSTAKALEVVREPMDRALMVLKAAMKAYPSPPPHSTYRRTQTLGRRWTTKLERGGRRGVVGNNTTYAPWVQKAPPPLKPSQARCHKGRWQTDVDVIEANKKAITDDFERAIGKALGK